MVLYKNRIGEVKRIEEIVGKKFSKTKAKNDCRNCEDFYQLNSRTLSNKINDFYSFEKRTMKDIMGFHFYTGTLLCDKISTATEMQQLSFIAGLFLTNGSIQEDIYKITLYNSPKRFECIKNLLLKLGTEITVEKINKGEIPVGYFLEFKPSEKVKQIMENEIKRKSELEAQTS